jgi:hypothetical protein
MFRITPAGEPQDYKTYGIHTPLATHTRLGTCEEANCEAYLFGWSSFIDESSDLGKQQAYYIRKMSGRHFTEDRLESGLTEFLFGPGQDCFNDHRVQVRPSLYVVRDGDWRGNPRGTKPRIHSGPAAWLDDFATHQAKLADQIEKG